MKTLFILVDALKSSYLTEENMPFLYRLSQESLYIKNIIPCAGFCERSEIFTGLDGYDTGNFTAIGYNPENSPYAKDSNILKIFSILGCISEKLSRYIFSIWRTKNKRRMNAYRIPYDSLSKFALTEDGYEKLVAHRSIFDSLKEAGKTYTLDAFTALSDLSSRLNGKSIESFATDSIEQDIDFIPLYIGLIDSVGHKFGNDIDKIKPFLRDVDNKLSLLYWTAKKNGYAFSVLGDHGMVHVHTKIDVQAIVKSTKLKLGQDYEAFYDSTIVRFWFFNDRARETITNKIIEELSQFGFIVDQNNFTHYRIPLDIKGKSGIKVYGDIVWCANPGILISPDYFHSPSDAEKGMHGYLELVEEDGTGLFILSSKQNHKVSITSGHSYEICSMLCDTLEIEAPNSIGWQRLI